MALWHWNWMLAVDNSMTRHCRTRGSWSVVRGSWFVARQMQRACILARPSLAYTGLFQPHRQAQWRVIAARSAIAPYRRHSCRFGNGASLRRDMLFWNCGIVKMSHYGIVALRAMKGASCKTYQFASRKVR